MEISALIDRSPVSRAQILIVLSCAVVVFFDGYDLAAIGYVAPLISKLWGVDKAAFGAVFSSGFAGLMLGTAVVPVLADSIGRKPVLLGCVTAFGLATLATSLVGSVTELGILRFVTGVALGGATPNAIALVAEYSPRRRRASLVILMMIGFTVGQAASGWTAGALIGSYGWQSVFYIGGLLPLLCLLWIWRVTPESAAFLAAKGRRPAEVCAIMQRLYPDTVSAGTIFVTTEERLAGVPLANLFRQGRAVRTVLLWIAALGNFTTLYFLANWLPTVVESTGATTAGNAAWAASLFSLGGAVSSFCVSFLADRWGARLIAVLYFLGSIVISLFGLIPGASGLQLAAIFGMGMFVIGGQAAQNAVASMLYPTYIRSTGVGWSMTIGRTGSILGPFVGGMFLSWGLTSTTIFRTAAVPEMVAALTFGALAVIMGRTRAPQDGSAQLPATQFAVSARSNPLQ